MKFGFFNDSDREYVITSPATPQPWINYLGNEEFFSLISNTCGGYSFYKDAKLLRLTRYRYNNVPADTNGRYYFIKHNDTVWTPAWQPVKTELDSYECRHGLGYSRFTSSKNKIEAKLTAFVPLHETCEVNQLILTNNNETCEQLDLTSYVEFCFWNAVDDATNFQHNLSLGEVEVCGSEIYHKTEYRERRNHFAYYTVNAEINGFNTSRDAFLGVYGSIERPQTVLTRASSDSIASGGAVIGSHHLKVILKPGESKSFVFVLGYSENPYEDKWEAPNIIKKDAARAAMKRFSTDEQVEKALNDLKEYWNTLLATFSVDSADEKLNRMVNIWNQYQCMVTFNMSRSASYFESGTGRGMGFRDSCQDLLGFVHLIPDRAHQRILDIAATQFEDGSAYHQYQPLTKKGNSDIGSGFNDDPLWLIAGTAAYIKETGDLSILDEIVDFNNDPALAKPLSEHLKRSFDYTLTHLGPNGLPLIGRADWNDCLNLNCFSKEPGESFQTFGPSEGPVAESVFIAGMFIKYGIVLQQPAYSKYYLNLGEISSYPPGYKENAGIFCHNNPWVSIAETRIGRGDRAFEIYRRTCPAYIEEISEIHRTEPYVYSQMIAGKDAPKHGEAKNSWLTGTAAWTFVNVSQYILGIRPSFDGLEIDPCIPSNMDGFTATRKYRNAVYYITVKNPNHVEKGVQKLTVNGKSVEGTCVKAIDNVKEYHIEVVMG
ncbi:MAG: hypothetical protein E7K23_11120 [Lachnospiraceae bacterium]|nr:hypothetical protein [Lachnospiraceae bacterium]